MTTTSYSQSAIDRRRERLAFLERFPGFLADWQAAQGKRVLSVVPLTDGSFLVAFDDGAYLMAAAPTVSADTRQAALLAARAALEPFHAPAFAELDRLLASEREAMRFARMEKVIGAVRTNLPNIPELRDELQRVLAEEEG